MGRIYPIPSTIARTPSLHLSHLRASFFFKPIFSVSSSTCFFQVFFGRSRFLLPLTSRSRATLRALSSSLHSSCPYHLTPFIVANQSTVFFNASMSTCSSVVFHKKTPTTRLVPDSQSQRPQRLKSWHPFYRHAAEHHNCGHDIIEAWDEKWTKHQCSKQLMITPDTTASPGSDLPRKFWVILNRLRAGVGRFGTEMHK